MKRISYHIPRTIMVFTLPSLIICALPHFLDITTIKPEFVVFRMLFDISVTVAFFGALLFTIYAMIHNARLETYEGN